MTAIAEPKPGPAHRLVVGGERSSVVLRGIGWDGYMKLLEVVGDRHVRINYDRGDAEIMSPLGIHEVRKLRLAKVIDLVCEECEIDCVPLGSTTYHRHEMDRGLEPDDCFYLASIAMLPKRIDRHTRIEIPPDLAVEVDVTSSSLDRIDIYGQLGVPEIWRSDDEDLIILLRSPDGTYSESPKSLAFPFLEPSEVAARALGHWADVDVTWSRRLRRWVREVVVPAYEVWKAEQAGRANPDA